ncbi:MAG TPA: hypothetical protein VIU62_24685 [Chloroflexota bacterium]
MQQTSSRVHAVPHEPQLEWSVDVLTQAPPQRVSASGEQMHVPCEQTSLVLHAVPQLPQLERSVFVSTQVPLHLVWPVGQAAIH